MDSPDADDIRPTIFDDWRGVGGGDENVFADVDVPGDGRRTRGSAGKRWRIRDAPVVIHMVGTDSHQRGRRRDRVRGIAERWGGVRVDWTGDAGGGAETGVDASGVGEGVGESGDRGGEEVFSVRVGV